MFILNTESLLAHKMGIMRDIDTIKNFERNNLIEFTDIQGDIIFKNLHSKLVIVDARGVSFLNTIYFSFKEKSANQKEFNIYYWDDCGHQIDLFLKNNMFTIMDKVSKKSIEISKTDFFKQLNNILKSIYEIVQATFYPLISRIEYFEWIKSQSSIPESFHP